jgi:hypothetical protein
MADVQIGDLPNTKHRYVRCVVLVADLGGKEAEKQHGSPARKLVLHAVS